MITTMFIVMILCLALGFPMMIPLILGPMLMVIFFLPQDPMFLAQQMVGGISSDVLMAVPLFIFAADIMTAGRTSQRLLDFIGAFVGHLRGGYAITTAAACTMFGAISGSTQATVVAIGKPMRERLRNIGYKDSSAIALIINASDIALLIPPSIGMIIYALMTNTSVGDLFIAGVGPGLLIFLFFAAYAVIHAKIFNIPLAEKALWRDRMVTTWRALLPLGFPIIIVGGIYSGYFTPMEAAGVSVLYAMILEVVVYRAVSLKEIPGISLSTGLVTSAVFILVAGGQAFAWVASISGLPGMIEETFLGNDPSALYVLIIVAIFFFIGCMFVDPIVVILILTPIFFPAAEAAGVDPVHLGVVITFQAALGSATPPFGVDIFTASAAFNKSYIDVIRGTPPYIVMLVVVAVLVIVFEEISLFYRYLPFL
ncbi:tripartite ATP-independent transporter DctM subunit [Salsuginibacillus halophilus]|uniref:Tripartite ATP-independent transporter DctM subunit n=1 Tax=Salsuginibacillus halophilus TaxID=517424 RepID=A0A2P8HE39_9BACI|nr:TRAP transporter large permease [Salsuginibacillus halophilus]PSL44472.1 tripartite ATP-independent transporter DctM subunit [Salsuginibacillus halophilus]